AKTLLIESGTKEGEILFKPLRDDALPEELKELSPTEIVSRLAVRPRATLRAKGTIRSKDILMPLPEATGNPLWIAADIDGDGCDEALAFTQAEENTDVASWHLKDGNWEAMPAPSEIQIQIAKKPRAALGLRNRLLLNSKN
ncbi:MAG: hypothetical protein ACK5NG_07285, partial [Chthoniobacterales bacterium]